MRVVSAVLALTVSLVLVGNLLAGDQKKQPKEPRGHGQMMPWDVMLKGVTLSADQQAKVDEIKKEYGPKYKALQKQRKALFTPEQRKAREEAEKEAKAAGKDPREAGKAGWAAMKVTEEQKKKGAALRKEFESLNKEVREKIGAVLTAEQKDVLKSRRQHHRNRKIECN